MKSPLVTGGELHYGTAFEIYPVMMCQIMRDYNTGIPDYKKLTMREIRFFYDALRPELLKTGKSDG